MKIKQFLFSGGSKNKLVLVLSVLLVASFLLTSFASYFVAKSSLSDRIIQSGLPLTSDNVYTEIQRDLLRPVFISSLMANDTFLRDWIIDGEKESQPITRYLQEIKQKYNAFTSFFVSEATKVYYHSDGVLKSIHEGEERDAWYFRVRDMKNDYEINVDYDMANDDAMTVFINYKVFDYSGKYIGATGVGLTVNFVKKLIEKYQKEYNRNIYFVDTLGFLKFHPAAYEGTAKTIHELDGVKSIAEKLLLVENTPLEYKLGSETVYVNSRYIAELGWYLIVEERENGATKNILNTLFLNLAVCLVIIAIVLWLTNMTVFSYQETMETMAKTDQLTGLYNRRKLDEVYSKELARVKRFNTDFSAILLDIDFFKNINDEYGHHVGDDVLIKIGEVLKAHIRETDWLGRWGGEEFLILCPETDINGSYNLAEKLRKTIETTKFSPHFKVTSSFGVTSYKAGDSAKVMLARADKLLYEAKNAGRNCVRKS